MISLILAVGLSAQPALGASFDTPLNRQAAPAACHNGRLLAAQPGAPSRARKLGDLPTANLYLPVERKVGGCSVPTVVRYDVEKPRVP